MLEDQRYNLLFIKIKIEDDSQDYPCFFRIFAMFVEILLLTLHIDMFMQWYFSLLSINLIVINKINITIVTFLGVAFDRKTLIGDVQGW